MHKIAAIAVLLFLQALLSACSTQLALDRPGGAASPEGAADAAGQIVIQPENPYLTETPSVPGDARKRFEQALVALEQEDWEWAEAELQYLVEEYPKLSGPSLNLALLYQRRGELEQAEALFVQSINANSKNLTAYNQYAIFLREQGRFKEAEQSYLQALAVWEWHADSHRNIGVLYDLYMGDPEKALTHYHRYQEITGGEDRQIAGWIADLERQLMMVAQGAEL